MPDVVRLRFLGVEPVTVPALGRQVAPDGLVDIAGKVVASTPEAPQPDDAIAVEFGNPPVVRLFPMSLWQIETKKGKE